MSTVRLLGVPGRVVTVALLAVFMSGPASAEICIDMNLRFDQRDAPPALVESMKNEAASIWESYGVSLQWPATASLAQCASTPASFDVLLNEHPRRPRSSNRILGSTHLALRAIDHVPIYIDLEATEELLGSLSFKQLGRLLGRPRLEPSDVGRALGRVLAHEVGHVLLAARDHQPQGLMRPAFVAQDLLTPRRSFYTLSPAEVTRLRQRERVLRVTASEQTGHCPVTSIASAAADALKSPPACSVPPPSGTDPGS